MRLPLRSRLPRRGPLSLLLRFGAFACSALLLSAGAAVAQSDSPQPRLRVASGEQPITIASLDVRVVIHGLHAQTTQTVVFHNPNGRVLEGELEFPLPDGATVSGFALDVQGQLVDGVVVAKDKARVVLETEIRKGIDPGLVEQVRGNLYRTRIYPIPARGTRTVRLSWVSELVTRGDEAAYHLPLPVDAPSAEVAMRLEVVRAPVQPQLEGGFGNLVLKQWDDRWIAEAKWQGSAPARELLVRLPRLPGELVALEPGEGAESFFSISELLPVAPQPREQPSAPPRLALAWDASGSRTKEATGRELAFLEALLAQWPQTAVDLVVFRNRVERPVSFAAGESKRLLEALRREPSDGGTALSLLDLSRATLPHADDTLWLLCSDGLATLGEALPRRGDVPIWSASGSSIADRALLRSLGAGSGGQLLDLLALDAAAAADALVHPGLRLLRAESSPPGAVAELQISQRADRARVTVSGRLLGPQAEVKLLFGGGGVSSETRTISLVRGAAVRAGDGLGPVALAWAQGRIEALSLFSERNADALLSLGQRFGLVTADSSLLVLETLEQHLQYSIEPAASRPQLRADYLAQLAAREKGKQQLVRDHLDEVARLWTERLAWYQTEHRVAPGWRFEEESKKSAGSGSGLGAMRSMAMAAAPPPPPSPSAAMDSASGASAEQALVPYGKSARNWGPVTTPMPEPGAGARQDDAEARRADSAQASISIKPWDPQVPYLEPLRRAAPGAVYAAYLAQRERFASPSFFLDCAELLLRAGETDKGLRVLSNLAELRIDDPALLRVLAWRLAQASDYDQAAGILEKVLRLRPEEPHSRRDLALVLADRAEAQDRPADAERAVGLLYEVVQQSWDRFPEIELIALMELNRILARAERRGWSALVHGERVDARLRALLDLDLRVSLSWDADNTDVDLHVFEPTGEQACYSHNRTAIGGLVSRDMTQGYGPEEYLLRHAVGGDYAVKVHYYGSRAQTLVGPATMTATIFTNWGRPNEQRQVLTLRLDSPRDLELVGVVTIGAHGGVLVPKR